LQLLAEKGIQFRFQTTAKEFVGENGKLMQVVLKDGTVLPAELCVTGVGKISVCVLCQVQILLQFLLKPMCLITETY